MISVFFAKTEGGNQRKRRSMSEKNNGDDSGGNNGDDDTWIPMTVTTMRKKISASCENEPKQ